MFGWGNGAPTLACERMVPGHLMSDGYGLPISRKDRRDSPFEVKAKIVGRHVRLSVTGSVPIEGFLIQARQTEKSPPIGRFELLSQSNDSIAKYQNCFNNKFPPFSSITHTNRNPKEKLAFWWSPESNQNMTVTFYATLARNHDRFWVMQSSNKFNIAYNGTPGESLISFYTLSSLVLAFIINL